MRIALVGNDYVQQFPLRGYGGIETCVENLAHGLHDEGHEFYVVVPKRATKESYPFAVIETEEPPTRISGRGPQNFAQQARQLVASEGADVIWSQSNWSVDAMSDLGIPMICTFHDSIIRQEGWMQDLDTVRYRFISQFQYDQWVREPWERDGSFMCHTGLTEDNFAYSAEEGNYFLWCAGLNWGLHAKGLDTFLELARRNSDKHFVIHGAGSRRWELYLRWKSRVLRNVDYRGALKRGATHSRTFASARAFVMPTRLPEAFGRTSVEALSKGTPVIGTRCGANPEIIRTSGLCTDSIDRMSEALSLEFDRREVFESSKRFHVRAEIATLVRESLRLL
jgi:glycosyltransferase involved in cell wall biosynthesis